MLNAKLLKLPTASHQHRHEHHQVVVGVQGKADLCVDGNASHIDAWRACLVPTDARHDYSGDQRNHVLVIDVDPYMPSVGSHAHSHYQRLKPLFRQSSTLSLDSRFHDLFRQSTGTTPHQFLLQTRLEQASKLLERTSLSVSEISHRTGFSSQSALANALKKYRGTTASALRPRC